MLGILQQLGAVPALVVPGQAPITQSLAILEYLEARWPQPALLPADPWAAAKVFDTKIRRNIKLAESPSFGQNILKYGPTSAGANDYRALAGTARFVAFQREVIQRLASAGWASPAMCEATERFAFYERVKHAFAIVHTGELQPYANFILKKGVISDTLVP